MSDNTEEQDDISSQLNLKFTKKTLIEHLVNYIKIYTKSIPKMITIFFSIWAIAEIILYDKPNKLSVIIIPAIVLSILFLFYDSIKNYLEYTPTSLEAENVIVKKAFFKQNIGWQYKIAYEILQDRTLKYELSHDRIKKGAEFLHPQIIEEDDYINFIKLLPSTIKRLLDAAKVTCVEILPKAISDSSDGHEDGLKVLIEEIENLCLIYKQAIDFEKRIQEVIPPEKYESLHSLMVNWTEPIREGIKQFIDMQKRLSEINKKELKELEKTKQNFTITFDPPANIDEYNKCLNILTNNI